MADGVFLLQPLAGAGMFAERYANWCAMIECSLPGIRN
jgi:hypothetical protein